MLIAAPLAALLLMLHADVGQADTAIEADIVLKGGTIHDGTGNPGRIGDVAIKNDRIVAVGTFAVKGAPRVLDCTGLLVSPGFIDLHTHSDYPLQAAKTNANFNYQTQGVTTVVTGNCGAGPADVAGYFAKLEKIGVGTNVAHQVPHNAVRTKAMGNANREPTAAELKAMEDLVEQGMKDGAFGMATGLIYTPGVYAKTDEIVALAKIVAKYKGFYASHIRNEEDGVFEAIAEILEIARKAGIRIHISHIKVSGRSVWGKSSDVIAMVRRARKEGIEVTADQYPYTASSTSLGAYVIPARYREGTDKDLIKRLDDEVVGPKMKKAIAASIEEHVGGKSLRIARYSKNAAWQGKDLYAIAQSEKKSTLDIVLEITRNGGAQAVHFGMDDTDVRFFMKEPYVATASDGGSMLPSESVPHPRNYGTFPRKIGRFAIEDGVISVEEAIRSASGLPADILKLPERGYLKTGYFADIVVFDPKTFRDTATFDRPHQYATGVRFLFVNGRPAIDDAKATSALPGRVLRKVAN